MPAHCCTTPCMHHGMAAIICTRAQGSTHTKLLTTLPHLYVVAHMTYTVIVVQTYVLLPLHTQTQAHTCTQGGCVHTHSHTQSHAHTVNTHSHTVTHTVTRAHTQSHTQSHAHTHTATHTVIHAHTHTPHCAAAGQWPGSPGTWPESCPRPHPHAAGPPWVVHHWDRAC